MKELRFSLRLCVYAGERNGEFGPGIASLLIGVEESGSLLKAAEGMGMAYSKAWKSLKKVEENLGIALISRETGRGHGSTLTAAGEAFLISYQAFQKEVREEAERSFRRHFAAAKQ